MYEIIQNRFARMLLNIISQNLNITLSNFQDFMTFVVVVVKYIDFKILKELDEWNDEKNKMQKQKHYISTFEQSFDLRRFKKFKIRKLLNVFEAIRIFEKYIQK